MALQYNRINDIVLLDLADNQGYTFGSASISSCGGDTLHTKAGELDLPVYQSYDSDPSKGKTLTAQMVVVESLLRQLFNIDLDDDPPIRIQTWNLDAEIDVFPKAKTPAILAETLRAKGNTFSPPVNDFASGWPDQVAAAIISEVATLKASGGKGGGTKFSDAVNDAMYENQSPQQALTSIMKLRSFCVQSGRGLLGLGTNLPGLKFTYNFGGSLLFNPSLYMSKKGLGKITLKAQYSSGNSDKNGPPEDICAKAIVIYNSTRNNSGVPLGDSNLSFAFRPDDTFSDDTAVKNEIMTAARTFGTTEITEGQLQQLGMTQGNWLLGNAGTWTNSPVQIEGGLKVRCGLNPPRTQGAGVFNIAFGFNFGSENGSLTISNLVLSFTMDIAKYVEAVQALKQYRARCREAVNNYNSQLAARAAAYAAANKTANGTTAPITKVDIDSKLDTSTNFATRVENAANTMAEGTDMFDAATTEVNANVNITRETNDREETRTSVNSDVIFDTL